MMNKKKEWKEFLENYVRNVMKEDEAEESEYKEYCVLFEENAWEEWMDMIESARD